VSPETRALVEEHLAECRACQAHLHDLQRDTVSADAVATVIGTPPARGEAVGELRTGEALGRYVVRRRIGAGGMGVVYEAHDPLLDRAIALKVLRSEAWADSEPMRLRFVREAQALARVTHANVVPVHDVGRVGDRVFIAMDLVDGTTAEEWLRVERRGWRDVLTLYLRAGSGLAAAHDVGLVHRDFKPANVLVGRDGRVCVTDFGLVRIVAEASAHAAAAPFDAAGYASDTPATSPLTHAGAVMGSPGYMAPEQMVGGEVGPPCDVFSFGVSLYEGLYGARPFAGETLGELCAAVQRGEVAPAPEGSTIPPSLRAVILRALAPRPEERPSMRALLDELERERGLHTVARAEKLLEEAGMLARAAGGDAGFVKVAARLLRDFVEEASTLHRLEAAPTPPPGSLPPAPVDAVEAALHASDEIPPDAPHLAEVEMSGAHAQALLNKLGFRVLASHFMLREGLGVLMPDGSTGFDPRSWYPALPFLRAAHKMSSEMGPRASFHVGLFTKERAERRRAQPDMLEALRGLDATYHRNFRRRGRPYVDEQGAPLPGIGRYLVEGLGPTSAAVVATGPWPCSFDRGLVSGVVLRIAPEALVEHSPAAGDPCRAHGATRCVYRLRWGVAANSGEHRLRPAATVDDLLADPLRRVLKGETFLYWYVDPHLEGVMFRGAPRADELETLIRVWDALKREDVEHGTIIDLRAVREVPPDTFALLTELLQRNRDEYGRRLRLAVIRPALTMVGALVTGALQMANPLHPYDFFDDEAGALAWLGHDDATLAAELSALRVAEAAPGGRSSASPTR
jgi:hypothetical protein